MALQLSTTYRNAMLDQFESTVGTSAKLEMFTGSQPANCAAGDSGTKLVSLSLPSDYMAAASSGSKALSGTWQGTGIAAGTAGYFRVKDSTGTTTHMQGSITATGGGGDLTLDNVSIAVSQTVTITGFTIAAPGV